MSRSPAPSPSETPAYFPALTGVRALAAYLVFVQHVRPDINITKNFAQTYLNTGHTGVTIFFVLSGFLISYRYAAAFRAGLVDFKHYLGKRFARIFPLYIFLTAIILVTQRDFNGWHWFLNLTLLKGFFNVEKDTGIFQAWSLTVEETFYLLAPLLFAAFRKIGFGTVLLLLGCGVLLVLVARSLGSDSFFATPEFMLVYTFFGRSFEFFCGYQLARFLKTGSVAPKLPFLNYTWLGITGMLLLHLALNLAGQAGLVVWFDIRVEALLNNFVLPVAIAAFLYGLITEKSYISTLLATKPVQFLGRISFAFYLIHSHQAYFYDFIYFHLSQNKFLIFLLLNVLAMALYKLVEQPANQFLNRQLSNRLVGKN